MLQSNLTADLTESEKDRIVAFYTGQTAAGPMGVQEVAVLTGISVRKIQAVLAERGVERHKRRPLDLSRKPKRERLVPTPRQKRNWYLYHKFFYCPPAWV